MTAENLYDCAMQRRDKDSAERQGDGEDTACPPPELLVTGHFRERPDYAVYRRHGSGNWLVTHTVEGHGLYRQPGVTVRTEPGDIVLLRPGALHDYSASPGEDGWEFLWAHFHPRPSWLAWWCLPSVGDGLFHLRLRSPQARDRVRYAFLTLHADACAPGPLAQELALNGLERAFLLAMQAGHHAPGGGQDPRVQQALAAMTADLAAPHDLTRLAHLVALSPSRLAHLFTHEVGNSVGDTILSLRLRQAARLLEHTPRDIGTIAVDVGFNSAFYFSRQFSRRFGMSPRAYRRMMAQQAHAET